MVDGTDPGGPMVTPKLTVAQGEVTVTRGGVPHVVKKGDEPYPLQFCDTIAADKAQATEWSIKAAAKAGSDVGIKETKPAGSEGMTLHYKENRRDEAVFEITSGPLTELLGQKGKAYVMVYIDPPPSLVLETPTVRVSYRQAVYLVTYEPDGDRSTFTVLDGEIHTAPEAAPDQVTVVRAGQRATYAAGELVGVDGVEGYPRAPAAPLVLPADQGRMLVWPPVREGVDGAELEAAAYNVYRADEPCFVNTPETFLDSTAETAWLDADAPASECYYRVSAVALADEEVREGPASALAGRVDAERDLRALEERVARLELGGAGVARGLPAFDALGDWLGGLGEQIRDAMPIVKTSIDFWSLDGVAGGGTAMSTDDGKVFTAEVDMELTITHKNGKRQKHHIRKGAKFNFGDPMIIVNG